MNYLFRNEWHDVPLFSSYPSCHLVEIDYSLPLARALVKDQRQFPTDWRKVWNFIYLEGLRSTITKVRSKRLQEYLSGDSYLLLAFGRPLKSHSGLSEEVVICLGTRHPACAEVMLFREELVSPIPAIPPELLAIEAVLQVVNSMGNEGRLDESMSGYNCYSELPPPEICIKFLQEAACACRKLSSAGRGAGLGAPSSADMVQNRLRTLRPKLAGNRSTHAGDDARLSGAVVVGAGDYTRTQIAPALGRSGIRLHTVVDLDPHLAEYVRKRFRFHSAATCWRKAIQSTGAEIVVIASYHDSHAEIAASSLYLGKKVFLEKPPVVTRGDLNLLLSAASRKGAFLEIGYNRRFALFSRRARELLQGVAGPTSVLCRIREVEIPREHWYHWPREGTRITGNICHWIDLAIFLIQPKTSPVTISLTPQVTKDADDERGICIAFADGSTINIIATSRGDGTLGVQEYVEARRENLTIRIDDYCVMMARRAGRSLLNLRSKRDRGHSTMYRESFARMKGDQTPSYPLKDLILSSLLTINATEMVKSSELFRVFDDQDFLITHEANTSE